MNEILNGILQLFVVLFAISVHEASHGWAALKKGDPTAFHMGRITLNPIRHVDPIGTVLLLDVFEFMLLPNGGTRTCSTAGFYKLEFGL